MRFARGTYVLVYDPLDQQVDFEGIFRPISEEEVAGVVNFLVEVHDQVQGTLIPQLQAAALHQRAGSEGAGQLGRACAAAQRA